MDYKKRKGMTLRHILAAPFIYYVVAPFILLDICVEIFHQIAFRLYGLPLVKRQVFMQVDRHRLNYLNWMEKINCAYCGYVNGLIHYHQEIAGRTEQYWCGIKHQENEEFKSLPHHKDFVKYDDEKEFKLKYLR